MTNPYSLKKEQYLLGCIKIKQELMSCMKRHHVDKGAHTSKSLLQRLDLLITLFLQLCQFLLFAQLTNSRHTLPVLGLRSALG